MRLAELRRRARARLRQLLRIIARRVPPGARTLLGLVLMVGGVFGFLPILGFWMIPLGVAVVMLDVRPLWQRLRGIKTGSRARGHSAVGGGAMTFRNRTEAGRALAQRLIDEGLSGDGLPAPLILALPRGGVPVALEVARALGAPLDLVMVRKIGVPSQPELAAGAVVNGDAPQIVVNDSIAAAAGLDTAEIEALAERQLEEIRRRRERYLAGRPAQPIAGRSVVIVDDGIATGATMRAALAAVRQQKPALLVLAVPVAAPDTLAALRGDADRVICLESPRDFRAVGMHYRHFDQVGDDAVVAMLRDTGA